MTDSIALTEDTTPAPQEDINSLAASIDLMDPTITITYGAKSMEQISQFADGLLSRVRAKDAGPIGDNLTNLMVQVKNLDIDAIASGKKGFLERLPVIGSLFNSLEKTLASFKTLSAQVEAITDKLEDSMHGLLVDIEMLEQLYEHNKNFHRDLSLIIAAGQQKLEEARATTLPQLQAKAATSGDSMDAQAVRDFADRLNRFEKRLHDLQLSRTITIQTAPQIRLIQSNNQTLAEKIQSSILTTIPIWKNQMALGLSLHNQRAAVQLQRQVADTTNDILKKNAELLGESSLSTAREIERGIVDFESLKYVHNKLISTIEETLHIAEEGRSRRATVEVELVQMEHTLRDQLTNLASAKATASINHAAGQLSSTPPPTKNE